MSLFCFIFAFITKSPKCSILIHHQKNKKPARSVTSVVLEGIFSLWEFSRIPESLKKMVIFLSPRGKAELWSFGLWLPPRLRLPSAPLWPGSEQAARSHSTTALSALAQRHPADGWFCLPSTARGSPSPYWPPATPGKHFWLQSAARQQVPASTLCVPVTLLQTPGIHLVQLPLSYRVPFLQ